MFCGWLSEHACKFTLAHWLSYMLTVRWALVVRPWIAGICVCRYPEILQNPSSDTAQKVVRKATAKACHYNLQCEASVDRSSSDFSNNTYVEVGMEFQCDSWSSPANTVVMAPEKAVGNC